MPVITIFSASYCSGNEVAAGVAEKLGFKLIDNDKLIERTSKRCNVSPNRLMRAMAGPDSGFNKLTHEKERNISYLRAAIAEIIAENNVVYHGYAGHLVPEKLTNVLRVCLVANHDYRVKRAMESEGISEKEAGRVVNKDDNERAQWTHYLFKLNPWDKKLYDVIVPMHSTSVGGAVDDICGNAGKSALDNTPKTDRATRDFELKAQVHIEMAKKGHDVDVSSDDGNVTITINKHTLWLQRLEKKLKAVALEVPGVKSAETRVGAEYQEPSIYPKMEIELPTKILLVDDEKEFVRTLSERLRTRQMESAVAYDGEQALSMMETDTPDVMVLDLKMPGIDGIEVLRRVRKDHPGTQVIILTGHGSEQEETLAYELGAFAYLQKPVDIDVLAKTMKEAYKKINLAKPARDSSDED